MANPHMNVCLLTGLPDGSVVMNPPDHAGDMSLIPGSGREDPLEEGMATHSSILAWEIPWTEEPAGLQSRGSQRVGHDSMTDHISLSQCSETLHFSFSLSQWPGRRTVFPPPLPWFGNNYLNLGAHKVG